LKVLKRYLIIFKFGLVTGLVVFVISI